MGALIPIITALLPTLIKLADSVFSGKGQGADKKSTVISVTNSLLDVLVDAGKIQQADRESIGQLLDPLIEGVLGQLKGTGALAAGDVLTVNTVEVRIK